MRSTSASTTTAADSMKMGLAGSESAQTGDSLPPRKVSLAKNLDEQVVSITGQKEEGAAAAEVEAEPQKALKGLQN